MPRPQPPGVGQHVGLVHQRQVLARAPLGAVERVPHHPLHAEGGVRADLGGDLLRGVLAQQAAGADVRALGALAHHHHVDLGLAGQRAAHARVEPGRAQVHVVVELEAQPQQQPALQDAAGHRRVADRAEQDRVVLAQLGEHRLGQQLAGGVPAGGTEVVGRGLGARDDLVEDLQRLVDDLRPDAVAGDDRKAHADVLSVRGVTARYRLPAPIRVSHPSGHPVGALRRRSANGRRSGPGATRRGHSAWRADPRSRGDRLSVEGDQPGGRARSRRRSAPARPGRPAGPRAAA